MRGIAVLGSTGTIGKNALDLVARFPERYRVFSLSAAGRSPDELCTQIAKFHPRYVAVDIAETARLIRDRFPEVEVGEGTAGHSTAASLPEVDVVIVGIVGFAALAPTLAAARAGKTLALANKESVVVAGDLLLEEARRGNAQIIPVDSEHNALFQLLDGRPRDQVRTLVLTASGGPFWAKPELAWEDVTPEMAIAHPNWRMGPKISVDSATLMNKGLELIEACTLFDVPEARIEVWVHPQSLLHGAIWLEDGGLLAHLSVPDMRGSIGFAMAYPERLPDSVERISFDRLRKLEFFPPDDHRFPALSLARLALAGGTASRIALNAANEIAVERFLGGRLGFGEIPRVVEKALEEAHGKHVSSLEEIFAYDAEVRRRLA